MERETKLDTEFMECDSCRAKAGSPILCSGCLKNRKIISNLVDYINSNLTPTKNINH